MFDENTNYFPQLNKHPFCILSNRTIRKEFNSMSFLNSGIKTQNSTKQPNSTSKWGESSKNYSNPQIHLNSLKKFKFIHEIFTNQS